MPALNFEQIRERLAGRFAEAIGPTVAAKDPFVVIPAEKVVEVARFLRDEPDLAFDYLIDETAVDYPAEKKLRVVYHLTSTTLRHTFKFKVELDRDAPRLPSVCSVWKAANWLEREVYDLFGVTYEGHPDLRRLLMPDDWQGHPLRKDWQEFGGYHGISNVRPNALTRFLEADRARRAESAKDAPAAPAAPAPAASSAAAAAPAEAPAPAAAPSPAAIPAPAAAPPPAAEEPNKA